MCRAVALRQPYRYQEVAVGLPGTDSAAYYQEIPEKIVKEMWSRLPETLREILREMRGIGDIR